MILAEGVFKPELEESATGGLQRGRHRWRHRIEAALRPPGDVGKVLVQGRGERDHLGWITGKIGVTKVEIPHAEHLVAVLDLRDHLFDGAKALCSTASVGHPAELTPSDAASTKVDEIKPLWAQILLGEEFFGEDRNLGKDILRDRGWRPAAPRAMPEDVEKLSLGVGRNHGVEIPKRGSAFRNLGTVAKYVSVHAGPAHLCRDPQRTWPGTRIRERVNHVAGGNDDHLGFALANVLPHLLEDRVRMQLAVK